MSCTRIFNFETVTQLESNSVTTWFANISPLRRSLILPDISVCWSLISISERYSNYWRWTLDSLITNTKDANNKLTSTASALAAEQRRQHFFKLKGGISNINENEMKKWICTNNKVIRTWTTMLKERNDLLVQLNWWRVRYT